MALADLERGLEALVVVRRRQPDVDDRHVGREAAHLDEEVLGVLAPGDDVEVGLLEQPGQPFAQQHAVLGDRYAHGISAWTRVPPPSGSRLEVDRPEPRPDRRGRAGRSRARVSAPPTPSSVISTSRKPFEPRDVDSCLGCLRVLADVREALRDDVVRSHLDCLGQAPGDLDREADGNRGAGSELLERYGEAVTRDHGGVDPARDLAQLVERRGDLSSAPRRSARVADRPLELFLEQAEVQREGDQPLLGAVVEVALQTLTFILRGLDDPRARPAQLFEPRAKLDVQAARSPARC